MHLAGYLYEDYHNARSLEHKVYVNGTGVFFKSACSSIRFLLNSKVYYCVHENLLSLELIKPLDSTCMLVRCVSILIYLFI